MEFYVVSVLFSINDFSDLWNPIFQKDIFLPIFDHINRSLCSFLSRITSSGEHRKSWICLNRFKNYNSFFTAEVKDRRACFPKKTGFSKLFQEIGKKPLVVDALLELGSILFREKVFLNKNSDIVFG